MQEIAIQQLTGQFMRNYIHFLDSPQFYKINALFHVITKAEIMIVTLV